MAKRSSKKHGGAVAQYTPTEEAKRLPRRLFVGGKQVAVGGPVTVRPPAPRLSFVIREATQDEYRKIYEAGFVKLVQKIEVETEVEQTEDEG